MSRVVPEVTFLPNIFVPSLVPVIYILSEESIATPAASVTFPLPPKVTKKPVLALLPNLL